MGRSGNYARPGGLRRDQVLAALGDETLELDEIAGRVGITSKNADMVLRQLRYRGQVDLVAVGTYRRRAA